MKGSLAYCSEKRLCMPRRFAARPVAAAVLISLGGQRCVMAKDTAKVDESTQPSGVLTVPQVTIIGTGVSDPLATECKGLYATGQSTTGTRLLLTLRETPQSVSVVTRQRMDDQKPDTFQSVLENTTEISAYQSDSQRTSFYSLYYG